MKIKEIQAKSIITKSNLPGADYVINPYIGCMHGCLYCYARFMKRFTNHKEPWGKFVDVKINAPELIKPVKGSILLSSVTDPYQPIERSYKLTRKILEKLIEFQPELNILTKSDLIVRDIDLLKQFNNLIVTISFSTLDENLRRQLEPLASSVIKRITALKKLKKAGLYTSLFISPIIPEITDWREIINLTKDFVDEYWFENLNPYPSILDNMKKFLKQIPTKEYWDKEEKDIKQFCKKNNLKYQIYFHHSKR
ncbi:radical SAM protein [Candidatus Woesearchaeota archaeon]|nr:radical SAM protein [Candidatus Woesearchaeota archaeon]